MRRGTRGAVHLRSKIRVTARKCISGTTKAIHSLIPASFVPRRFTAADTSAGCLSHRDTLTSIETIALYRLSLPRAGIPPLIDGRKEEGMPAAAHNIMRAPEDRGRQRGRGRRRRRRRRKEKRDGDRIDGRGEAYRGKERRKGIGEYKCVT